MISLNAVKGLNCFYVAFPQVLKCSKIVLYQIVWYLYCIRLYRVNPIATNNQPVLLAQKGNNTAISFFCIAFL